MRAVAGPGSRLVTHSVTTRTRLQPLAPAWDSRQHRSLSYAVPSGSAASLLPAQAQQDRAKDKGDIPSRHGAKNIPGLAVKREHLLRSSRALLDLPFDKFMQSLAPETYDGGHLEAQDLDQTLAGAADWADLRMAALVSHNPSELRLAVQTYLAERRVALAHFLALRNALLAKSWPDARRHMVDFNDGAWPAYVLRRAIHTVETPSEVSDALALVASTVRRASMQTPSRKVAYFRPVRYCFATLMPHVLHEHGRAFHLIPRCTDLLLALLKGFPAQVASLELIIYEFASRCTKLADERARAAFRQLLFCLRSDKDAQTLAHTSRNVVVMCINSIEASMQASRNKSKSSEHFANIEVMQDVLQPDLWEYSELRQRALRCAVYVAGRGRDYRRTWQWFNEYQQCKQERGAMMTGTDHLLLARALSRTEQGRKDAWNVFLRAERLLPINTAAGPAEQKELRSTCIHLLEVMAKSLDVDLERALALLGIFTRDSRHAADTELITGAELSKAMRLSRSNVIAYTVVMQGCLLRGQPRTAVIVWRAMLERRVLPTTACLSVLLQNLFQMKDVGNALRQLHLWCEEGVVVPAKSPAELHDVEMDSWSASSAINPGWLANSSAAKAEHDAERHKIKPDPILASVVFSGLHACGADGIDALWSAYQQTIQLFPDAPVLALLLKMTCSNEATASMDARFGRQVFRTMLFKKHPELAEYRNPLLKQFQAHGRAGWIFTEETVGAKMEYWLASVFHPKVVESPVAISDLSGLIFTSKLFEHYVRLLLHLQHSPGLLVEARMLRRELLDVLGYMRTLHLSPSKTHLALTILEVEEHLPPAVAAWQMEALDTWLIEWLGEEGMPTEEQMQRHWQWKMERNGHQSGWFDQVPFRVQPPPSSNVQ